METHFLTAMIHNNNVFGLQTHIHHLLKPNFSQRKASQ